MLRSSRNFSIRLFAVAVWLASLSQARGQNPQPDQSISIRGTVINSVTHEPIRHAQVYSPDNRFAVMTDDQGHFEVPPLKSSQRGGDVIVFPATPLMARKPGFLADRNGRGNVQVNSSTSDLTIPLIPEAILMGRIALDTGDSADGIQVQLFVKEVRDGLAHWSPRDVATTNSKGEFRFAELYAGDYRVGTHEVGDRDPTDVIPGGKQFAYPPVYFPEASDFPSASTIHLSPGKIVEANFSLARRPYYPIKISVSNGPTLGTPINVSVSVRGDGAPGYSLGYNAFDGTIRGALPNGIYVVETSTFSQQTATGLMSLRVANGPAEGGQLTLLPNGTIPVQVNEEFTVTTSPEENHVTVYNGAVGGFHSRSRHQYLNVVLEPVSDFGQGRGASLRPPRGPNDESLAIDNVQPDRYWVQVSTSRGYAASVTSGGLDLLHQPLIVGPGGSSAPIEITMRDDTASLDGTIEGADTTSDGSSTFSGAASPRSYAPFAYVYCIPQSDSAGQFTQLGVSLDGKLNSQQIPPGEYRILAFKHQQNDLEYRNPKAMRAYESKGQVVSLVAGQKEHVQLSLVSKADEDAN